MSLGVIAMGIKHANRIQEALRQSGIAGPDLDAFLDGTASAQARKELFFVIKPALLVPAAGRRAGSGRR